MIIGINGTIENYLNGDSKKFHCYFPDSHPLPRSLSQGEREDTPKGEDKLFWLINRKNCAAI